MKRTHRVGTITLGLGLILIGGFFLLSRFIPSVSMMNLLTLWPILLIMLGLEITVSYFISHDDILKYDGAAIVLTFLLVFFSMGMAIMEQVMTYLKIHI